MDRGRSSRGLPYWWRKKRGEKRKWKRREEEKGEKRRKKGEEKDKKARGRCGKWTIFYITIWKFHSRFCACIACIMNIIQNYRMPFNIPNFEMSIPTIFQLAHRAFSIWFDLHILFMILKRKIQRKMSRFQVWLSNIFSSTCALALFDSWGLVRPVFVLFMIKRMCSQWAVSGLSE